MLILPKALEKRRYPVKRGDVGEATAEGDVAGNVAIGGETKGWIGGDRGSCDVEITIDVAGLPSTEGAKGSENS